MGGEARSYGGGEGLAIHGERATGGQAVGIGHFHDQPAGLGHLPVQQAHGVLFAVIGAERVGADHLGQIAALMGKGAAHRAHFVQDQGHARLCGLSGGLGACKPSAHNMKCIAHGARCKAKRAR
jgi:hypothetical protein